MLIQALLHFLQLALLITAASQKSDIIVQSADAGVLGPVIELSASILQDGDTLNWTCRENTNIEMNSLEKRIFGSRRWETVEDFSWRWRSDNFRHQACSRDYMCTITSGSISWNKEKGGTYRCTAYPDEQFNVIWINPVAVVPEDKEYRFGDSVELFCHVEMTPDDINYSEIMSVTWYKNNPIYGQGWQIVEETRNIKMTTPEQGTRYTLTISDFSGIRDGGEYRCRVDLRNYELLTSRQFKVDSPVVARLTNDVSDTFEFALGETVTITCSVDSFPYVRDIFISVGGDNVMSRNDRNFRVEMDVLSPNENFKLWAKVTIFNITATLNNTVVACKAKRPDDEYYSSTGIDQRVIGVTKQIPEDRIHTTDNVGEDEPEQSTLMQGFLLLLQPIAIVFRAVF